MAEFSEIREAIENLRGLSAKTAGDHHIYGLDRNDASRYFYGLGEWYREVCSYITNLHEQDETTSFLDICGRTRASNLGCDMNYHFTIQERCRLTEAKNVVPVVGDLFAPSDFDRVISLIEENGHLLSLTTFMPVAGLQIFRPEEGTAFENVVYHHLLRQLTKVVEVTRDGGYILLQRPFQFCPHHIRDVIRRERGVRSSSHAWMRRRARSLHCKIRVVDGSFGPHWLLRKGYASDRRA